MLRLNEKQIADKVKFIEHYLDAENAADGSRMDANANVTHKNIATLESELMKDFFVQVNRQQMTNKITELQGCICNGRFLLPVNLWLEKKQLYICSVNICSIIETLDYQF